MASSLKELIEEWEYLANSYDASLSRIENDAEAFAYNRCISALRDTMIVMEAEEVRREKD